MTEIKTEYFISCYKLLKQNSVATVTLRHLSWRKVVIHRTVAARISWKQRFVTNGEKLSFDYFFGYFLLNVILENCIQSIYDHYSRICANLSEYGKIDVYWVTVGRNFTARSSQLTKILLNYGTT